MVDKIEDVHNGSEFLMLFLRVRKPQLKCEFGWKQREVTLWLQGTPTEPLYVSPGGTIQNTIAITITSEPREQPYEVGSLLFQDASDGEPADVQVWVHGSPTDIEAIYDRSRNAKYVYMTVEDENFSIADRVWNLDRGNPVAIRSYSFRTSTEPCFGELADQEPQALPSTPAPSVIVKESKYTEWLFWAVLWMGLMFAYKFY